MPPPLSCASSQDIRDLFPPSSLDWTAEAAIEAIEATRVSSPLKFYLYDDLPLSTHKETKIFTVAGQLRHLESCGVPTMKYHYGGDYHFLRQLVDHPWRTRDAKEAALLVIPSTTCHQMARGHGGQPKFWYCKGLVPMQQMMDAIGMTETWRTRQRDHVHVNLDWETSCVREPMDHTTNVTKGSPCTSAMRAFVETAFSTPNVDLSVWTKLLRMKPPKQASICVQDSKNAMQRRSAIEAMQAAGQHIAKGMIAAPYVDNGGGFVPMELARNWADEHERIFGAAAPARDIRYFFGGRTSMRIGPGRRQCGYYLRWWLLHEWARQEHAAVRASHDAEDHELRPHAPRALNGGQRLASRWAAAAGHRVLRDEVLILDSDGGYPWSIDREPPAAQYCSVNGTKYTRATGPLNPLFPPHPCMPPCDGFNLSTMNAGACYGRYNPSEILRRSRYALCMRGDIPTSPRPYDAMRYGAIPILLSDSLPRVGLPFQCLVPWRLLTLQVAERAFLADADAALANATSAVPPLAEVRMRKLIAHFSRDVLWRHPQSRVAENVLLTALHQRDGAKGPCCPIHDETGIYTDV